MEEQEILAQMNANLPPCVATLGNGKVIRADLEKKLVEVEFTNGDEHCHSGNIIQGGFIAGMIDNAMSVAVITEGKHLISPATLELKVTYLKSGSQGINRATGWIIKMGRSVAFLEGELHNEAGELLAKASSTARLIARK